MIQSAGNLMRQLDKNLVKRKCVNKAKFLQSCQDGCSTFVWVVKQCVLCTSDAKDYVFHVLRGTELQSSVSSTFLQYFVVLRYCATERCEELISNTSVLWEGGMQHRVSCRDLEQQCTVQRSYSAICSSKVLRSAVLYLKLCNTAPD